MGTNTWEYFFPPAHRVHFCKIQKHQDPVNFYPNLSFLVTSDTFGNLLQENCSIDRSIYAHPKNTVRCVMMETKNKSLLDPAGIEVAIIGSLVLVIL